MKVPLSSYRRRRAVGALTAVALIGGAAIAAGPLTSSASSHREAPLIAGDPRADNTDVYAFVSPDDPDTVTMIANWIPFEEPNGGPNFYTWAEDTQYNIKVDSDGDAVADLTYTWVFTTQVRNPGTFLYNTGPVTSVDDPDLNLYQTYDLTVTDGGGNTELLLDDAISAPSLVGRGSIPDYAPLVDGATYGLPGGGQTYVGQADDPFFLDLRVFDILYGGDLSGVGQDTLAGYNVNTVALQLPKSALALGNDPTRNPVIGVWSTTDRRSARAADGTTTDPNSSFKQVSRLGNPLVNEVVFPLALKDAFNSISPDLDATIPAAVDAVSNPILPPLVEAIYGIPAPPTPRHDLEEIFLQGVSAANAGLGGDPATDLPVDLNGHDLNLDHGTLQPSEQLRLNMSIAPSASPNRLGLLAGQTDGFPNGRRLGDDVVDIALQVVEGATSTGIVQPLARGDYVDRNDKDFRPTFPYLALPNSQGVNQGPDRPPRTGELVPVAADRAFDSRSGPKPAGGSVSVVDVTGIGSSMVPDDAKAVTVNVTATEPNGGGFLTAYNCDDPVPFASNVNYPGRPTSSTSNMSMVGVSGAGTICVLASQPTHVIVDVTGYVPATSGITGAVPERLLDTRTTGPSAQTGYTGSKPTAGQKITLDVTDVGAGQVAAGSKAAIVNVTAVVPTNAGWIRAYACDQPEPNVSALNYDTADIVANLVVAPIAADGTICLRTSASSDVLVDLVGVVPAGSEYTAEGPTRIFETRAGESTGQIGYTGAKPAAGRVLEVQVSGTGATPVPDTAAGVFLNVTTTNEAAAGFVTVFPCGTQMPETSNGNFRGSTTAHLSVTELGDSGRVCIYVSQATDVVVDLEGFLPGVGIVG